MNATTVAVDLAKSVFQLAAADAAALLEAARASDIRPVRIKSVEQQALQGLHRIRSLWMGTRTARINALRGFFREFGIAIPVGARTGLEAISRVLADPGSAVLELIRGTARLLVEEVRLLEARIAQLERELAAMARLSPACTTLLSIPGIGLLTATAMVAATSGDVSHFKDARHFARWFGLTPREYSSGNSRYLGSISKRGDRYLRMLLTHGARSVLRAATLARTKGHEPQGLRHWALAVQGRSNHNKAACALANKMARICYATLRDKVPFEPQQPLSKKMNRQAFAMPA
jgi:transposase